eukprot:COSAG02_NODE_51669_length_312_cov_1.441315_1_plen_37_part_10
MSSVNCQSGFNTVQLSDSCTSELMRLLNNEFSTDFWL